MHACPCVRVWLHGNGRRRALARVYPYLSIMQHTCVILSAASLAPQYFPSLSNKWHDFRKKVIEHKMCALIFSANLLETFLSPRRIQRHIVINCHKCLHVTYQLFLSDFHKTLILLTYFREKKLKYQIS